MLATLGVLPRGSGWGFELKWDGVRTVAYVRPGLTRLISRNDLDITTTYPELAALGRLVSRRSVVLDGEIVALDGNGHPSFSRLQDRMLLCTFMILNGVRREAVGIVSLEGQTASGGISCHLPSEPMRSGCGGPIIRTARSIVAFRPACFGPEDSATPNPCR